MDKYELPKGLKLKIRKMKEIRDKSYESRMTDEDREVAKKKKPKYRKQKKPAKMNIIDARAMTQEAVKEGMEMMRLKNEKKMKKY